MSREIWLGQIVFRLLKGIWPTLSPSSSKRHRAHARICKMSGKPAARVTDPTACPIPGHGTNPIVSGSPDVLFDGLPAARQGDPTACGSGLASNLVANVFINGLPVATLGSVGNHGNVVVGGSGTVIIGNTHTAAAVAAPLALPVATKICLPCLLLAASRNQTFVPLESLGVRQ